MKIWPRWWCWHDKRMWYKDCWTTDSNNQREPENISKSTCVGCKNHKRSGLNFLWLPEFRSPYSSITYMLDLCIQRWICNWKVYISQWDIITSRLRKQFPIHQHHEIVVKIKSSQIYDDPQIDVAKIHI